METRTHTSRIWLLILVLAFLPLGQTGGISAGSSSHSYRIGPNDVIRIQVFGEEDLTVESKVDGDGQINFPLLGAVSIAGKTVSELQTDLTDRLAAGYVRAPKVAVHVVKHRNFYVSGSARNPGAFPYEEGLTVQKALSLAGGLTEKAEHGELHVLRQTNDHEETVPVKLDSLVLPDDIIVVAEGQRFYVSGEVRVPGRYLYETGLTAHKAISMAGGFTEKSEKMTIKITRVNEGVATTAIASLDTSVLPGDIILVEPQHHKFFVSGEVKTPGSYPYKEGLTVHKALAMAGGLTEKAERVDLRMLRHTNGHEETLPVKLDSLVLPDDIIMVAEGQRFYISGEVRTPGRYLYEKGLTTHKAISMAGGFTEKAEKVTIRITRVRHGIAQPIEADLDAPVLPDDFVVVPQVKKIYVNGEVKRAGDYPYERGLTVHKVITLAGGLTDKAAAGSIKILRMVDGKEQTVEVQLDNGVQPEDIVVVPRSFF